MVWPLILTSPAPAQLPTSEERLKILKDPEDIKKAVEKDKEKTRPPIEMTLSQIAPFDVLPYVKANHWSTISLELRANYENYVGTLQTAPVPLIGLPQEMVYCRDARLAKGQRMRLGMQMILPQIPKPPHAELNMELVRPDAVRPDEAWSAPLAALEPHQMLVVILTKDSNGPYAAWNRYNAVIPQWVDPADNNALDRMRYYRLVLPFNPDKPPLSPHPLTWTTISHIVWDGMAPDTLNPSQQQALLDWLHWGGQLTLVGGAGPAFSILNDSFLSPYLPAETTGDNALLKREDLTPLSQAYPPLNTPNRVDADDPNALSNPTPAPELSRLPGAGRDQPAAEPAGVPVGPEPEAGGRRDRAGRVGRALDRRRVAGRAGTGVDARAEPDRPRTRRLAGDRPVRAPSDLAKARGRCHHGPSVFRAPLDPSSRRTPAGHRAELGPLPLAGHGFPGPSAPPPDPKPKPAPQPAEVVVTPVPDPTEAEFDDEPATPRNPVAEWVDTTALPLLGRDLLEEASGIKIPSALFVLEVVLAYILTLVPLNWLICRFVFGRRELAWIVVPILSLGFAYGVERASAYDVGYNSACDEIVILEAFGDYPRAHVSRFSSLYSTGRARFNVSFPSRSHASQIVPSGARESCGRRSDAARRRERGNRRGPADARALAPQDLERVVGGQRARPTARSPGPRRRTRPARARPRNAGST